MKKRLLSVFLVVCMLLTMFSGTAWAAEETNVTVIRIPGSNATFTLENANSEYGILANLSETLSYCGGTLSFGQSSAPTYVFTFPGEDGRITCDTPAYVDSCGAYFMGDSGEICAGGGDREESGTWQAYYDLKPYVGHSCTLVNIYADGSLNAPYGSEIIATVLFAFGYPVDDGASDDLLPNEADRYLLSEWTNSAQCGENLTWTLDSEGTLNISGTGAMWDWSITDTRPWEDSWSDIKTVVIGAGVTHIGNYAFRSCIGLERVEMPDGLLTIGNHAFAQCYDLTNVEIPDSVHSIDWGAFELCQALSELHIGSGVTSIGSGAFSRCYSLTSVEIPSGLSAIPDSAFSNCSNLASVEIPDGITSIGGYAFYHSTSDNQALKNIIIPASVTEIGAAVFDGCTELTDIYYTGSEAQWKLVNINRDNEQLFAATLHFEASGTAGLEYTPLDDGTYEVSGIGSVSGQHIVIPATHNGTVVSSIGEEAFKSCTSIVSVKIPEGVTSIGQGAFYGCSNLESVELPKGITTIPNNLFCECLSLKQIVIPDNVTSIGDYAFLGCYALPDITIPYGVIEIGREAFANCHSFEDITIPGSVQDFGTSVFGTCENLKHVTFCDGVTTVGNGMFSGCENLSSITFADSITKIGRSAFQMCSSLTNLELPGSVEHIGYGAFHWCDHLSSLTVPNAEVVFEPTDVYGIKTFALCKALEDVYFGGTEAQWIASGGHSALAEANISPTVHYSEEKAVASGVLRSGEDWSINWSVSYTIDNDSGIISDGALKIEAIGSGEESDLYIFNGAGAGFPWESEPYNIPKTAIESIDIQGNLAVDLRVTTNAFKGYSNLKTLNCSFVSGIDSSAFEGCDSLTTVKIAYAGDAFSYGAKVFKDCTKLNSVDFPNSLTNIGDSAFQNTALSGKITLGSNITNIGTDAFSGCNDLTIRCYEDSVAHQYAVDNSIPFELILTTDNSIVFGVDQWSFRNYSDNPYYIVNIDYKKLVNGLSNTDMETVNSFLFLEDGHTPKASIGSCYGMSATVVLAKMGRYQPSSVHAGATSLYSIPAPNDDWVESFITFYQVQQKTSAMTKAVNDFMGKSTKEQLQIIENMASQVSVGGSPFLLSVTGESDGHAVVAYGVEHGNYSIGGFLGIGASTYDSRILLYDCNYPNETTYMYYDIDTEQWQMQKYTKYNKLRRATSNVAVLDYFTPGLAADETLYPTAYLVSCNESNQYTLIYDGQAINIDASTDDRENGFITYFDCCEETDGTAIPMTLLLPSVTGNYSVVPDGETYYLLNYGDFSLSTNCGDAEQIDFFADGAVTLTGVEGDYSLSYVRNEEYQTVPWYKTTVSGNRAASITLKETNEGILLEGDLHDIEILATDKEGSYLLTLDTRQKSALVANATSANISDPVILLDMDENGTYETPYGAYTITFDANGGSGSAASAVTGVDGTLDSLPTASRGGYRFNGWYTARSGGEQVTTAFVFTEDTTIYAQWTYIGTDDGSSSGGSSSGSSSTLTFNTNGGTSIPSIKKTNGTVIDLADYVPTREGYTFSGWFADPELTEKITTLDMRKNTTIYAGWSIVNPFTDVTTDSWFYDAAMFVYERGLMNGIGADLFGPDIATTRGMLVTILWRQDGAPEAVYDGELNDVPDTMYYAPAVKWAAANGIMGGYGDGKFGPDDSITREQMAAILWRYAQYKGYDVSVTEDSISDFNDVSAISNYAVPAMQWVCSEGIMSGKPGKILDPTGTAKRSEIAAMLMRFLENVK